MFNFDAQLIKQAASLDLASEAHRLLKGDANTEVPGVVQTERNFAAGRVVTIRIVDERGEQLLGRSVGTYTTIELADMHSHTAPDLLNPASEEIAHAVSHLLPVASIKHPILVVGLGNLHTTADAIGPRVISHIQPTCHFFRADMSTEISPVAALAPGVVGNTGIETAALIKATCDLLHPAAVIAVDALAARKLSGVMHSVQICDTGIRPGSGVANHRTAINQAYLGVPVIAIGIPTVVQAAVIIQEAATLTGADDTQAANITGEMLSTFPQQPVLTPKDADELVPLAALIIAAGLTRALHPAATERDFSLYMQRI